MAQSARQTVQLTGHHRPDQHPRAHIYPGLNSGNQHVGRDLLEIVRHLPSKVALWAQPTCISTYPTKRLEYHQFYILFFFLRKRSEKKKKKSLGQIMHETAHKYFSFATVAGGFLHGNCGVEFRARHTQIVLQIVETRLGNCISVDIVWASLVLTSKRTGSICHSLRKYIMQRVG
jgi:hypothetical protein